MHMYDYVYASQRDCQYEYVRVLKQICINKSLIISDATVWQFKGRFGFFLPETAVSAFKSFFFFMRKSKNWFINRFSLLPNKTPY